MLRIYDTSSILSIVSGKESEVAVATDFLSLKPVDSVVHLRSELPEIESFNLRVDPFLLAFNEDPYDLTHEIYWETVFRDQTINFDCSAC